jgi:ATP-dependent RNA circularization protein (DNA/RNA ligase family)
MNEYHKIQTVFLRDPDNKYRTLLMGQYAKPEFKYLELNEWIWTEKVDGTNIRVIWDEGEIRFAGKTDRAQLHPLLVARLEERFLSQRALFEAITTEVPVCLYGEGYGPKIQSGGKYRSDQDFVLFDVWIGGWWLERHNVEDVAEKFGLDVVPIIGTGSLPKMVTEVSLGFQSQWGDFIAEGIVARPAVELFGRNGERVVTKVKYKDFER